MANRRVTRRQKIKHRSRKARKSKERRRRKSKKVTHFSTLIALLTLLYVLRLIDAKTYKKVTRSMQPGKRTKPRKRIVKH